MKSAAALESFKSGKVPFENKVSGNCNSYHFKIIPQMYFCFTPKTAELLLVFQVHHIDQGKQHWFPVFWKL